MGIFNLDTTSKEYEIIIKNWGKIKSSKKSKLETSVIQPKNDFKTEFKIDNPRSIEEQIFENDDNESYSEPQIKFDTECINVSSSDEENADSNIQNNSKKDQELSDFQYFQSNINDFKENKMHKDVLFRLIKDWTANDMKNIYVLKEFIMLKEENERLRCENNIILENFKSENQNSNEEKKKIKTEV